MKDVNDMYKNQEGMVKRKHILFIFDIVCTLDMLVDSYTVDICVIYPEIWIYYYLGIYGEIDLLKYFSKQT